MEIKPFGGILYGGRQFGVGFEGSNDIFIVRHVSFHDLSITMDRVPKPYNRILLRIDKFDDNIGISSGGGMNRIEKTVSKPDMIKIITTAAIAEGVSRDTITKNGATVTRRVFDKNGKSTLQANIYISAANGSPYLTDGHEGVKLSWWNVDDDVEPERVEHWRSKSGPLITDQIYLSDAGALLMSVDQLLAQITKHATLLFDPLFVSPRPKGYRSTSVKLPGIKGGQ